MNDNLQKIMIDIWIDWHDGHGSGYISGVNPLFSKGFKEACDYFLPLLQQALPYVEATAGASHLTDGFRRQPENEHDILVKKIKECLD